MNLSHTLACDLVQWYKKSREMKLIVCQDLFNDLCAVELNLDCKCAV